ncbi:penicillin-binding protein, partial [Candidatus Parcubacteria bacterium]
TKIKTLKIPNPFMNFISIENLKPKKQLKEEVTIRAEKKKKRAVKNVVLKPSIFYKLKFFLLGLIFSLVFIFLPLLFLIFISDLPNPNNLSINYLPKTTKIYDRQGSLLYEFYVNQNRTIVKLEDIPISLRQATIAIEDKDFYNHPGFDLRGITRAFISNLKEKEIQGGSTITQQLIRAAFLTPEKSLIRKGREVILAFWAERIYPKNKILELYFNYVPYGGTAWGIESASEVYFGKDVRDLNLAESAFLAGLPRAPSVYSPHINGDQAWKKRQLEVLQAMVKSTYITQEQADAAYKEELNFENPNIPIKAPHFVMYIKKLLIDMFGLSEVERGGLQVITSLDLPTQELVEEIVAEEIDNSLALNITNGAALVTNPQNGDILAMVGSKDYFDKKNDGNVNVTTSLRQPGSTIKIVTYSLALSSNFTEATILNDSPLTITSPGGPSYSPVNYDGTYRGNIPLRLAFANSLNIPAVKVTQKLGVDNIVKFGKELGISSWSTSFPYGLSITLGGGEVTMVDLATAYGTIANQGKKVNPNPILEIKDSYGKNIYKKSVSAKPIVDEGVAFIVSDILADNQARSLAFGLNSPLNIPGYKVSVKTGTTDNKRDNWTIGYTNNLVVATWVGNNDNSPMSPYLTSGITGAAPMWNKIMTNLLTENYIENSFIPGNIIKKPCYGREYNFIKGTEKSVNCNLPNITPTP